VTAHYYHHSLLWYQACAARDRCAGVELPGLAVDALTAIVMSAAACESLINGIAADAQVSVSHGDYSQPEWLRNLAAEVGGMVDGNENVIDKYKKALASMRSPLNAGGNPLQDCQRLIGLRNGLMHLKTTPPGQITQIVRDLGRRRIARTPGTYPHEDGTRHEVTTSWVDLISTHSVAAWSCEISWQTMHALLEAIPQGQGGAMGSIRRTFPPAP
jgi:hypothetical protein